MGRRAVVSAEVDLDDLDEEDLLDALEGRGAFVPSEDYARKERRALQLCREGKPEGRDLAVELLYERCGVIV